MRIKHTQGADYITIGAVAQACKIAPSTARRLCARLDVRRCEINGAVWVDAHAIAVIHAYAEAMRDKRRRQYESLISSCYALAVRGVDNAEIARLLRIRQERVPRLLVEACANRDEGEGVRL